MADVLVPLTNDERTVLMIAAEGQSMMPIGRWQDPVQSLTQRGLLKAEDTFNCVITPAGREAVAADDVETDRALTKAYDHTKGLIDESPVGPVVVNDALFFKMPDGSSINCMCIREPYASQIVAMWRNR